MSEGPQGPTLEMGGPAAPAKAVSIGGQVNFGLSNILTLPLTLLNPIKVLQTATQLVGGSKGFNALSKGLEISGQFTGLLKASPKLFLKGAGKGSGSGGAMGAIGDAATNYASKGIEQGSKVLGQGLGKLVPVPGLGTLVGKTFATTGQLTAAALRTVSSVLRGKFNDLVGGKAGSDGLAGSSGRAAEGLGKGVGSALGKPTEAVAEKAGATAGKGAQSGLMSLGKGITAIPIVGWVCGPVIMASGPVVNAALRSGSKLAGKATSKLVQKAMAKALKTVATTLTRTVLSTVRTALRTVIQTGIQAARARGNCRATNRRTVALGKPKPPVLNPIRFATTLGANLRNQVQRVLQVKARLKAVGRRVVPLRLQKTLGTARRGLGATGGFAFRTARSGVGAIQASASTTLKLSESAKNLSKGDAHAASKDLQAGASAGKGALRSAAAPGKEVLGKAWQRKKVLGKTLGKVSRPLTRPALTRFRRVVARVTAPNTRSGSALARARRIGQGLRAVKTTVQRPFKAVHRAVQPVVKAARGVTRTLRTPVKVVRTGWGIGSDGFQAGKALGAAPMALSKGAQAFAAQGDAGAALGHAHQASQSLTALPDAAHSTFGRVQGLRGSAPSPSPGAPPPQPPSPEAQAAPSPGPGQPTPGAIPQPGSSAPSHHSPAGRSLWGRKKG